jgi:hypothetical protein
MLDITIRATKDSVYLVQLHQISVHNIASIDGKLCEYRIYLNGKEAGKVIHHQDDGPLELAFRVLLKIMEIGPPLTTQS